VVVSPTPSVVAQEVRGVVAPPTPSVVVQEAVQGGPEMEDVVVRLPRHLRSTMTCMRVRRKHRQVGMRAWSLDFRILLQFVP
jgi:hypothetical protein